MRILRVAQNVYPDQKGGASYHVHAMSRDQVERGHEVTVLTTRKQSGLPRIEQRDGYTVVRAHPGVTLIGNDVSPGVARHLWDSADRFDVIHAHSHLYFSTNLAALTRRLRGVPLAITNHGLYSQSAPEWAFDAYLRTLGRWTFDQADVIFCYTGTDEQRIREFGVGSRIEVVPNGIDTERFTPEGRESDLIDADGPVVLFVGRLVEGKRPGVAVEAVDRLSGHDVELYVCGDGPLRSTLEATASSRITFLGSVPYDEMPAVYRAVDLLVLPSRAEGVPRTIMEALSTGVPVVSSDLPQVRSAFGDSIVYVPGEDPDALAEAIRETLAGRREIDLDGQFSWERTVDETTAALERVAGGG